MKKLLLLLVLICITTSICGCRENKTDTKNPDSDFSVIMPTDDTVNGYKIGNSLSEQNSNNTDGDSTNNSSDTTVNNPLSDDGYFINTNTKKFHLHSCRYAQQGSANGESTAKSRDELVREGYSPCKICKP